MDLDWQSILITATSIGTGVVGYFVRQITRELEEAAIKYDKNAAAISALQLDVAKNYVTHADLSDIKASLLRIEDKIDKKQDREHRP
jgi:hypothetical protein